MATAYLPPDFKEFLMLLNSFGVEYLLVGGYAVGYYGYPRATADMDVWVGVGSENAGRIVEQDFSPALADQRDRVPGTGHR